MFVDIYILEVHQLLQINLFQEELGVVGNKQTAVFEDEGMENQQGDDDWDCSLEKVGMGQLEVIDMELGIKMELELRVEMGLWIEMRVEIGLGVEMKLELRVEMGLEVGLVVQMKRQLMRELVMDKKIVH